MNGKYHLGQIRKNWVIISLILTVVFGAGVVWAVVGADFVEMETFEIHVRAEERYIDGKFEAQDKLIDQKFKNTNEKIEDLDEHLEDIKDLLK